MTRDSAIKYIKQQSPEAFLLKAKKRGFVCPKCGNGTGSDGDGIVRNPKDGRYHCFKCGEVGGDIFDLIGAAFGLSDFSSQLKKAADIYGVSDECYSNISSLKEPVSDISVATVSDNVSDYLEKCRKNVRATSFFLDRGLSDDTVERYGLGFDPEFSEGTGGVPWQAAVFPTSRDSYEVRNVAVPPNSPERSRDKYRKHGKTVIFNLSPELMTGSSPLFVCEGIMDALSVIECGGQALALGSASNYRLLLDEIDKNGISCPLVLLFDADEAGKKALDKLSGALAEREVLFYDGSHLLDGHHDANARLIADPDGLSKAVLDMENNIAAASDDNLTSEENEFYRINASCCMGDFRAYIEKNASSPAAGTGFSSLDAALNGGFYPGLYIFGAVSSLGKTTLLLQMADFIAASGRDVLFFSLEQSRFELMSKSISRESFEFCREKRIAVSNAKNNLEISDGSRWEKFGETGHYVVSNAFRRYEEYASHLFICEGTEALSADNIREMLRKYVSYIKKPGQFPVVIVDYLQILSSPSERLSDKQVVDRNVTALKQISRDYNIPLLAVSSLNRYNYSRGINMEAFKESGSIEYGADVLIGLQFEGAGENGFDMNAARSRSPRHIELCILKNRNGRIFQKPLLFDYFSEYNCFVEK